uniref:FP protein C-terminal domain-containing protein n=1 Tax=Cacopsylla melanoneura TaxID=428564 RepID=A0A8D8R0M1_9HEMI
MSNNKDTSALSDRELILKLNKDIQGLLPLEEKLTKMMNLLLEQKVQIEKMEKKMNEQMEENKKLRSELKEAKDEVSDLQQRQRLNNIIINGIPEAKGENVIKIVESLGDKLGISNPGFHIQVAHRVKTKTANKVRPIVVRLINTRTRDAWTMAFRQKQMWKQKIYVSEHLTKKNQDLLAKTKELKLKHQYQYVWVKDCRILVRKNEKSRVYAVRNEDDLERIFEEKKKAEEEPEENF